MNSCENIKKIRPIDRPQTEFQVDSPTSTGIKLNTEFGQNLVSKLDTIILSFRDILLVEGSTPTETFACADSLK